jgi:methyl acetate hydrolase
MHGSRHGAVADFMRRAVAERLAPGVAAAVVDQDRLLFLDAAGTRDAAAGAPLTPDAIFRIASMTKPITSLAAMLLVEDGAIDLDAPATRYLVELDRVRVLTSYDERDGAWTARPPSRPITLRHLLTHTAGMSYSFLDSRLTKIDTGNMARVDVPLLHDPGERFTYSFATAAVGSIVAAVSGTSLDEFCRARIFEPLGMIDTGYAVPAEQRERVVTMQVRDGSGFVERPNPPVIASRGRGDDGLFSTAADYGKFIQLFLNLGMAGHRRVAGEETIRAMMSNQLGAGAIGVHPAVAGAIATPFPIGGEKDAFGFGFQIETAPPRPSGRSIGSCSWSGIWNTYFWIDPAKQFGGVVLMQFMPAHDAGAMAILNGVERIAYEQLAPSP